MNLPLSSLPTAGPPRKRSVWEVQRSVLFALLLREMKARVGGQWVGAVWTLFEPLAHVALMVTLFGFMRGSNVMPGIEYPVFLATGMVPFFLFQHLANRLMDSFESNRGLFAYRQVKPLDTLLSRATVETLMNLAVYAFTLGILGWMGFHIVPNQPLQVIGVNLLLILFGTAFGTFAAVVTHERPRLRSFIRMLFMPLYIATGVIFKIDLLPREYIEWLLWNPLLHLIELSRASFISEYKPTDGVNLLYPVLCTLALTALALGLYRVNRLRLIAIT